MEPIQEGMITFNYKFNKEPAYYMNKALGC